MFEWAYAGVDHTLPGNGGQECVDFIPLWQRVAESGLACVFAAICIKFAYKRVTLPETTAVTDKRGDCGKRVLLVAMCLTFGIELGFKLATRQFIWIFNPCHVTSMIQIYILAAPPGKLVTAMFRLHLHMLTGAPIAILFPVINTRLLPFETEVYFIQHILMMIIPYYLMSVGGVYTPEKLRDMSWGILSLGWLYFFHFVPLNYLAVISQVNLNNMLCPAVSDPFYGRLYRICAMGHQVILLPVIGKFIVASSYYFNISRTKDIKEVPVFVDQSQPVDWSGKIDKNCDCSSGHCSGEKGNDRLNSQIMETNREEFSKHKENPEAKNKSADFGVIRRNGMRNNDADTTKLDADDNLTYFSQDCGDAVGTPHTNGHSKQI
ncbi:transmembrane protein 164-like isoform X1 [Dreissena polymorpha]|uniref:transmembrane protein 164-like isoform X1 n=1 Tax=Dreissena polymorpha TaxID=45954 RepID=UPI002264E638|nr:transmembrane protein 164-like isoform X1 [Dreissena polymorpha]XP_052215000.1 transmembrane protein 164-like isoform X1 [Dreissena polymorpha]XP_052215001.1 transmembrane protein 164-like isoform X1 [Dreissena polymorpha]